MENEAKTSEQAWRDIEKDRPPFHGRVIVAGWHPKVRTFPGYWWMHEDETDAMGYPIEHKDALLWQPWPAPPSTAPQEGEK